MIPHCFWANAKVCDNMIKVHIDVVNIACFIVVLLRFIYKCNYFVAVKVKNVKFAELSR